MTLDLNRCLLFTDKKGNLNPMTSRKYINIVDGVISGEGEGPMCGFGKIYKSSNPYP